MKGLARNRRVRRRRPRALVILSHPVQYFSPLFEKMAESGNIDLIVLYQSDAGIRETFDPGFGRTIQWDYGQGESYPRRFCSSLRPRERLGAIFRLIANADVVLIHGYSTPFTALSILVSLSCGTPYVLRTDSTVIKRRAPLDPRRLWANLASRLAYGAITSGLKNAAVHRTRGVERLISVPFTVDVERFAQQAAMVHADRPTYRRKYGIAEDAKVVVFAGKLQPHKRPDDLLRALEILPGNVHALFIGDGELLSSLQAKAPGGRVTFAGFVNQSRIPEALACGDVIVLPSEYEPWGLAVNEGLACGLVPVVSDRVGCGPDLVEGVGEIYPVGDICALAGAIDRALHHADSPRFATRIARFRENYSLAEAARLMELALCEAISPPSP